MNSSVSTPTTLARRRLLASSVFAVAALSTTFLAPQLALAHEPEKPQHPELQLNAEAIAVVATDELVVTLASEQEGAVVAALNSAVLKQLNDALALAKKVPGVEARLSSLHTNPNWESGGKRKGWRVRGELVLRGKNLSALSELAGKLGETLQFVGAQYRVSPELQAKTREALISEAAEAFKVKARASAKALGFNEMEISNVSLSDGIHAAPPVSFKGRGTMMAMTAESGGLPTEGGTERVSVTFSGTVKLKR